MDTVTFGLLAFNRRNGTLARDGKHVALGGRSSALLTALLDAKGSVVSKADLMERAWPGLSVEEGNLTVQMAALRKALGQRADNSDWIVTVARIGYRLWAEDAEQPRESSSPLPSLAVLPFHNLSDDATQDYFADGIVDDLITALSRFKTFAVISRNSSFVYKGRAVDVREIGRELGVRYVLGGSIRRSGSRLRVTAQLVDTATAGHLWAQNYDGALEGVFEMQDGITESVVSIVEPMVKRAEIERTRLKPPTSLDAYDLYLEAMALVLTTEPGATMRAIKLVERSLALDPDFPPAIAMAAIAYTSSYDRQVPGATEQTRLKGLEYSRAALAVAGGDAKRGLLMRIDPSVTATTYRCAIVSERELAELRRICDVVRLGRVRSIEATEIVLDKGRVSADPDTLYINCTASGLNSPKATPMFERNRINLQMVRWCQPAFSAALAAFVESLAIPDVEKAVLCAPVPAPDVPRDWLVIWLETIRNMGRWAGNERLTAWLSQCRLNTTAVYMRGVDLANPAKRALVEELRDKARRAAAKLPELLASGADIAQLATAERRVQNPV